MCANREKLQMKLFGLKCKNSFLSIDGQKVKQSEHVILLGVDIDSKLVFDEHAKEFCQKINPAFSRARRFLNKEKAKILLTSIAMSNFSYCPLIKMFCVKTA